MYIKNIESNVQPFPGSLNNLKSSGIGTNMFKNFGSSFKICYEQIIPLMFLF